MARSDLRAKIRLEGDSKGAVKAIKKTDGAFKRLGKTIKTSALAQVAAIGGVVLALRGFVRGISASISAANKQADAINALEGALAPLGDQVERVSLSLQAQAAALQKVTTFGDETIIEAQAMIASFVKEESSIKAATKATLELAEAKGFDLVAAADLVSKTLGSSTNALTRYGIEVTGAVGSTERITSLTENIAKVFGGRAAKATETFSGKIKQLGNAWGDLAERVGQAITDNEDANQSIDDLKDSINEIAPAVANFAVSMIAVATAVVKTTAAISEFIAKFGVASAKMLGFLAITDDTAVSMNALADAAAEQGISIDELKRKMDAAAGANRLLGERTREAADAMDSAATLTGELVNAQGELDNSASDAAGSLEDVVGVASEVAGTADDAGDSLDVFGDSLDGARDSASTLRDSMNLTKQAMEQMGNQAALTAAQIEALALAQARTNLAATQASRGSIATRNARNGRTTDNRSSYGLSQFGTGGRYTVDANGTMEPA
jgi:chromosome segregation ATPase